MHDGELTISNRRPTTDTRQSATNLYLTTANDLFFYNEKKNHCRQPTTDNNYRHVNKPLSQATFITNTRLQRPTMWNRKFLWFFWINYFYCQLLYMATCLYYTIFQSRYYNWCDSNKFFEPTAPLILFLTIMQPNCSHCRTLALDTFTFFFLKTNRWPTMWRNFLSFFRVIAGFAQL